MRTGNRRSAVVIISRALLSFLFVLAEGATSVSPRPTVGLDLLGG